MTPLAIPVPSAELLEPAIGWSGGDARWISIFWTCCGDCPWMEDGRSSMTGHAWGLLAWWRHGSVAPVLRDLDLGSSERDGMQRLVLERRDRRVFVASTEEARRVVRDQWPAEEPVELTTEQWAEIVEEVRQRMLARPLPSMGDLMEQMRQHSALVAEMIRWLDSIQAEQAGG